MKLWVSFGAEGTNPQQLRELCAAMGINPPSLYAAFGNKADLFMAAVHYYERAYWDTTWDRMDETPDVCEAMAGFFQEAARILTSQEVPCGCLVILAATNVSSEAQEVNDKLRALRQEGRSLFVHRVQRAVNDRQLPSDTDSEGLASSLNAMFEGMSLLARDGASQAELERIATTAMALIPRQAEVRLVKTIAGSRA